MRKIFHFFCIYGFVPLFSLGQNCKDSFLGSKTLYQNQQQNYIAPPEGYLPVFINHVGRHGARHLTKDVSTSSVYKLLLQCDSLDCLSDAGKLLKAKILLLEKVEKKGIKSITLLGTTEQHGIAERMFINNKNVFSNKKNLLHISYTKEIRTLQTCDAFLDELKNKISELVITKIINDTTLRYYDLSPAYDKYKNIGPWHHNIQQFKDTVKYYELTIQVVKQFFTETYFKNLTKDDLNKFTSELFGFVNIVYSIQQEIKDAGHDIADVDLKSFFTCSQLSTLSEIDNAEDYYVKGPGIDENGIQIKIAMPLLVDFINTTDEFIKKGKINTQLRFCHAETISPIAALMGFSSKTTKSVNSISQVWNAYQVIPLSSNIQWILYQKPGTKSYLIKFLLNEKEVPIKGLPTKIFPYYNWSSVRALYVKKLASSKASLKTDFVQYLKEVQ